MDISKEMKEKLKDEKFNPRVYPECVALGDSMTSAGVRVPDCEYSRNNGITLFDKVSSEMWIHNLDESAEHCFQLAYAYLEERAKWIE